MASRLKYSAALIACCAVIAVLTHWWHPERQFERYVSHRSPDRKEYEKLAAQKYQNARMQQEYLLIDSLLPHLSTVPGSVTIELSPHTYEPDSLIARLLKSELPGAAPLKSRIGFFVFDGQYGLPDSWAGYPTDPFFFTGTDGTGGYCIIATPLSARVLSEAKAAAMGSRPDPARGNRRSVLGPCQFWARYGPPGGGVERWLRQGGYHFASAGTTSLDRPHPRLRQLVGLRTYEPADPDGLACRAGDTARCVQAISRPLHQDTLGIAAYAPRDRYGWDVAFGSGESAMIAQLETQYGAEKFATFWHSDQPLEPAFANAFGRSAGEWTRDWAQHWYGVESRGPRISLFSWMISLTVFALLAGAAFLIAKYREVM